LVLKSGSLEWGPKPFRFNNFWLANNKFKKLVEDVWRNQHSTGWMGVILKNKLKVLKEAIRAWNKLEYGDIDTKVAFLVNEIADLDVKGEFGALSSEEVELRKTKFDDMWKLFKSKDASVFQRSKSILLRVCEGW